MVIITLSALLVQYRPVKIEEDVLSSIEGKDSDKNLIQNSYEAEQKSWSAYRMAFIERNPFIKRGSSSECKQKIILGKDSNLQCPFVLKGTIVAGSSSYVIVEDLQTGTQDLIKLGHIKDGFRLIRVNRNFAEFERIDKGKIVLSMFSEGKKKEIAVSKEDFTPRENKLHHEKIDFAQVLTKMRLTPHFVNGKCVGYKVVKVEKGSVVEKVGVKEGDIIQSINGVSLTDPVSALQMFYNAQEKGFIHLGIERQDSHLNIEYKLES